MSRSAERVDIDVADAFEMREDRHARLALHARDQALAAARHDDVDGAVEARQHLADGGAVGRRHELDRVLGQAGRLQALDQAGMDGARGIERIRAAAQDHGVAGLQAQRAGIGGHVGAALVDHADDAERRAHALDVQAVRPVPCGDHLADRIGQRGDRRDAVGHGRDARRRRASAGRGRPAAAPAASRVRQVDARWRRGCACSRRAIAAAMAASAAFFAAVEAMRQRPGGGARARGRCRPSAPRRPSLGCCAASQHRLILGASCQPSRCAGGQHQVVAMDHRGAAGIAENGLDLARTCARRSRAASAAS